MTVNGLFNIRIKKPRIFSYYRYNIFTFWFAFLFFTFLFVDIGFTQLNEKEDTSKTEISDTHQSLNLNSPNNLDSIQPFIFYNYDSKLFTVFKPDYNLIRNKLTYSMLIQRSFSLPVNKPPGLVDRFNSFKESLKNSLSLEYKKRPNYDLGEITKYLGISQQIFAIILGIISLL